jgi:hypothetical protein
MSISELMISLQTEAGVQVVERIAKQRVEVRAQRGAYRSEKRLQKMSSSVVQRRGREMTEIYAPDHQ